MGGQRGGLSKSVPLLGGGISKRQKTACRTAEIRSERARDALARFRMLRAPTPPPAGSTAQTAPQPPCEF